MPEISRFFGIVIYMNWREHPPMHFHAVYGEHEALMTLDGKVYAGSLPGRALSMVREWMALHRGRGAGRTARGRFAGDDGSGERRRRLVLSAAASAGIDRNITVPGQRFATTGFSPA